MSFSLSILFLVGSLAHAGKAKDIEAAIESSRTLRGVVSRRLQGEGCEPKSPENTDSLLPAIQIQDLALAALLGDANKNWLPKLESERRQLQQTEQRVRTASEAYPACVCGSMSAQREYSALAKEADLVRHADQLKDDACGVVSRRERQVTTAAGAAHAAFVRYSDAEDGGLLDEKGEGTTRGSREIAAAYGAASDALSDAQIAERKAKSACKAAVEEHSRIRQEIVDGLERDCLEEVRAGTRP